MLLQRVITAVVLLIAIGGALFLAPPWVWGVLSLALLAGAGWEWAQLIGARPGRIAGAIGAGGVAWLIWRELGGAAGSWLALGLVPILVIWTAVAVPSILGARLRGAHPLLAVVSLLALWVALHELRVVAPVLVLSAMAIVWCADIGAYFVGRAFGRRKLAPRVSPGKSWEGVWGGLATTIGVALAIAWVTGPSTEILSSRIAEQAGVAAMVAGLTALVAFSVVGDLYESLMKRSAGVKDSGRLLPGHGGILDRIDALVPTMPMCLLLWMALTR